MFFACAFCYLTLFSLWLQLSYLQPSCEPKLAVSCHCSPKKLTCHPTLPAFLSLNPIKVRAPCCCLCPGLVSIHPYDYEIYGLVH